MNDSALILFTLTPEAEGPRKRLGGVARTREIFATLIEHLQSVCAEVQGLDLLVASPRITPPRNGRHLPQRGRDFAESLRLAFEDAFALGYRRVLAVGNDTPEITPHYLRRALSGLGTGRRPRAALGPTRDGGYALLGLARPCAAAFSGVRFGGSSVAAETRQRLSAAGFAVFRLPPLEDIDDAQSLQRVLGRLRGRLETTRLAQLLRRLRRLLAPPMPSDGFALTLLPCRPTWSASRLRGPPKH